MTADAVGSEHAFVGRCGGAQGASRGLHSVVSGAAFARGAHWATSPVIADATHQMYRREGLLDKGDGRL